MTDTLKHLMSALVGLFRSSSRREAEILILRQQLSVLHRKKPGRARLSLLDRFVLVWLYRFWPALLDSILIVKPETVVRWHRNGFRSYWRWKSRNRGGRPMVDAENGHVERVIGSIRRECLDHVIVFSEAHLRRIMRQYVQYYNSARTHLSLEKDSPDRRAIQGTGAIKSIKWLGGLHHQYVRI